MSECQKTNIKQLIKVFCQANRTASVQLSIDSTCQWNCTGEIKYASKRYFLMWCFDDGGELSLHVSQNLNLKQNQLGLLCIFIDATEHDSLYHAVHICGIICIHYVSPLIYSGLSLMCHLSIFIKSLVLFMDIFVTFGYLLFILTELFCSYTGTSQSHKSSSIADKLQTSVQSGQQLLRHFALHMANSMQ